MVLVFLGNGDGTFQAPVGYPTLGEGNVISSIAATDFNQDGKLDLAATGGTGEANILLGNGDGTFNQTLGYLAANTDSQSLTLGDFNGDGAADWVVTDIVSNTVGVILSAPFKAISPSFLISVPKVSAAPALPKPSQSATPAM
jgi:hypothetical protein